MQKMSIELEEFKTELINIKEESAKKDEEIKKLKQQIENGKYIS